MLTNLLKRSVYVLNRSVPWSHGYHTYKYTAIEKAIKNSTILKLFKDHAELPPRFGYGIDERIVEYPWILTHIPQLPKDARLMDAGSTLNFESILNHPRLSQKQITIVNLNPEENCFWYKNISYSFEDIRSLSYRDSWFDCITCISTLEHVGMDNTIYTKNNIYNENKSEDYLQAVQELKRILKQNGSLLITVPFGQYRNYGFFQQFNGAMVQAILQCFKPKNATVVFYKYTSHGWQNCSIENCKDADYFNVRATSKPHPHKQASAGAVACLKLIK